MLAFMLSFHFFNFSKCERKSTESKVFDLICINYIKISRSQLLRPNSFRKSRKAK